MVQRAGDSEPARDHRAARPGTGAAGAKRAGMARYDRNQFLARVTVAAGLGIPASDFA